MASCLILKRFLPETSSYDFPQLRIVIRKQSILCKMAADASANLFKAVEESNEEGVAKALEAGAEVNGYSGSGDTALHLACKAKPSGKAISVLKLLLEKGADVSARNKDGGYTALHRLAANNNANGEHCVAMAKMLVEAGADLEAKVEGVTKLEKKMDDVMLSRKGMTPLLVVLSDRWYQRNNAVLAKALLELGADANARTPDFTEFPSWFNGYTPLHFVATTARLGADLVDPLVKAGANVDALSGEGDVDDGDQNDGDRETVFVATPLHLAVWYQDEDSNKDEVIVALLNAGADVNAEGGQGSREGFRPLHVAAEFGNVQAMKLLKKHAGDNLQKDPLAKNDFTPLQWAIIHRQKDAILYLLKLDAEVKAKTLACLLLISHEYKDANPEIFLPPILHGLFALQEELTEARKEIEELKEQMKQLQAK